MSLSIGANVVKAWAMGEYAQSITTDDFEIEFKQRCQQFDLSHSEIADIVEAYNSVGSVIIATKQRLMARMKPLLDLRVLFESTPSDSDLFSAIERVIPGITSLTYPRPYSVPKGYASPKILSGFFYGLLTSFRDTKSSLYNDSHLMVCKKLIDYQVPTYFLSKSFLDAATNTDLPEDISLSDIEWPMPAMLFSLPDGLIQSPHGPVRLLSIALIEPGEVSLPIFPELDFRDLKQEAFSRALYEKYGVAMMQPTVLSGFNLPCVCISAITDGGKKCVWFADVSDRSIAEDIQFRVDLVERGENPRPLSDIEAFTLKALPSLALQTLLIMTACPEMVETVTIDRPSREKHGVKIPALWKPNFIGRKVFSQAAHSSSYGFSVGDGHKRMHWRRGHMRNQRYGKGLEKSRITWIRPVLVSGESASVS